MSAPVLPVARCPTSAAAPRRRGLAWLLGLALVAATTPGQAWPGRASTGPSPSAPAPCAPAQKAPAKKATAKKSPTKKALARKSAGKKLGGKKASPTPAPEIPPEPMLSTGEAGVVDYSQGEVRALGVGTPEILSPTGDITRRDLYETALDDASRRLGQTLARVRLGPGAGAAALQARLRPPAPSVLRALELGEARFFTDGSVHAPVRLGLTAWLAASAGDPAGNPGSAPGSAPGPGQPATPPSAAIRFVGPPIPHAIAARLEPMPVTGVVIALASPSRATLGVRLSGGTGGAPLDAGLPGDAWAGAGLRWFRAGDPALAAWVGPAPRILAAAAAGVPGDLTLTDATADLATLPDLGDLPVAVVVPR